MFVLDPFGDQKRFQDFGTISDTRNVTLVWSISRIGLPYKIDTAIILAQSDRDPTLHVWFCAVVLLGMFL